MDNFKPLGFVYFQIGADTACFNTCRRQGIQGSNTDFLLCAVAMRAHYGILSNDNDFINFSNVLSITLCSPDEIGLTQ